MHFVDSAAATMPQAELSAMSKTQLLQCITALQAGWTAATKRLADVDRNRELATSETIDTIAQERAAAMAAQSRAETIERECKGLRTRNFELETEVAKLRRAMKEDPANPAQARLHDELVQAQGRIIELERLVRQREPLNAQFMRIRNDELVRQRDKDRMKLQENALAITRLEQRLKDALEATQLERGDEYGAAGDLETNASASFHRGHGQHLGAALQPSASVVIAGPRSGSGMSDRRLSGTANSLFLPIPGVEQSTQTEAGTAKLVEMLQARGDTIAALRAESLKIAEERDDLANQIAGLKAELTLLRDSDARKDALLDEYANTSTTTLQRRGSFRSKADLDREGSERAAMQDRSRRLEGLAVAAEERAKAAEAKALQLEVEVGRITRSFAAVAEENVQLSHSLQAIGGMTAKDLAVMLSAGDKVVKLKADLDEARTALDKERVNGADLQRLSRENGGLRSKIERHQLEIGAMATENARVSAAYDEVRQRLEATVAAAERQRVQLQLHSGLASRHAVWTEAFATTVAESARHRGELFASSAAAVARKPLLSH